MKWIDKNEQKPDESSGRIILTFTPGYPNNYRLVTASLWKTLSESTHWMYLHEPGEKQNDKIN